MSRLICLLLLTGVLASGAAAQTKTSLEVKAKATKQFYVDEQPGKGQVTFSSKTTLEDFTGVDNQLRGKCMVDPTNLEKLSGRFSIRVADMKTGIDLRDQHMRGPDWLDAEKFPDVVIEITSAEEVKKTDFRSADLKLVGKCSIKGVTKEIRVPASLVYMDESPDTQRLAKGDIIRLRSEFKLKLSDYGVNGPKGGDFIGLKVSDEIGLTCAVFAASEPPPEALKADPAPTSKPGVPPAPKRP